MPQESEIDLIQSCPAIVCSFCGYAPPNELQLLMGPNVSICSDCVFASVSILKELGILPNKD